MMGARMSPAIRALGCLTLAAFGGCSLATSFDDFAGPDEETKFPTVLPDSGSPATSSGGSDADLPEPDAGCTLKTTGPLTGRATSSAGAGRAWTQPNDALTVGGEVSRVTLPASGDESVFLVVQDFGFQVPAAAKVQGVFVAVLRRAPSGELRDRTIQLAPEGNPAGDNRAAESFYSSTLATTTYGSDGDLWGQPLTPAVVNGAAFGVGIKVVRASSSGTEGVAEIDFVTIDIAYCE